MEEKLTFANGTTICWEWGLDGGGSQQYLDFLPVLDSLNKKYDNALEWCSGLGAIGFSILDAGWCDTMSFMDFYEPCEYWTNKNMVDNNLNDRIQFYLSDKISKLPIDRKFSLVVANPPHCQHFIKREGDVHNGRLIHDDEWQIHTEFFSNIKKYLTPGADILLSENEFHESHVKLAESNGLKFVKSYPAPVLAKVSSVRACIMHYIG